MATSSQSAALAALRNGTPARDAILYKGVTYTICGTYEKVAGNTDGDYLLIARVHKDWCVESIMLANDALTGATDINVGLVADDVTTGATTVVTGVTDVDENCYADAVDIAAGIAFTEVAYEIRDIAKCGQYVWQDAGVSTRAAAAEWYNIAIHFQSATTATGTMSWRIKIVAPG
jgi:hypothetical protein